MRNKLVRTIFLGREAGLASRQLHLPHESAASSSASILGQVFSKLTPLTSAPAAESIQNAANPIGVPVGGAATEVFDAVSKNLERLRTVTETQVSETRANTTAISTNTAAKEATQALSAVSKASGGLLSGFTALPLVSGLLSLFGGGSNTPRQQPLTRYIPPGPLNFDNTVNDGSAGGTTIERASYDQFGNPRTALSALSPIPDYSSLVATARGTMGDGSTVQQGTGSAPAGISEKALATGFRTGLNSCHGQYSSHGQPIVSRQEPRHCPGGKRGHVEYAFDQRCRQRPVTMFIFPDAVSRLVFQYPTTKQVTFSTQIARFLGGGEQRYPIAAALNRWRAKPALLPDNELAVTHHVFRACRRK